MLYNSFVLLFNHSTTPLDLGNAPGSLNSHNALGRHTGIGYGRRPRPIGGSLRGPPATKPSPSDFSKLSISGGVQGGVLPSVGPSGHFMWRGTPFAEIKGPKGAVCPRWYEDPPPPPPPTFSFNQAMPRPEVSCPSLAEYGKLRRDLWSMGSSGHFMWRGTPCAKTKGPQGAYVGPPAIDLKTPPPFSL